ncbi:MAG: lipopolysaccharide heptosyltransferase II [Gammaproteobacteria bacterium]|nr:lipopolysaccharide heptosyltransferase II [Gammaproteobacteria bacterium]
MVMAQSLFRLLKQRHPLAELHVLAPAWTEPLLTRMPEVDDTIAAPFAHGRLDLLERLRIGRTLRRRQYDWAIVLPNSLKSALVPFAARIRQRTGYVGELRYGLLNDMRRLDEKKLLRMVDRFAALGLPANEPLPNDLPPPRLIAKADEAKTALARLNISLSGKPILALAPGAEYGSAKRWPEEYYADLANAKLNEGWDVWLFGSEKDSETTREIQRLTHGRCVDLAGHTRLGEAIDLLALVTAVVSNDSGLMHIAAALNRPMVAIFGSSDPRHTPPLSTRARVVYLGVSCSPCFERECPLGHLRCLFDIAPAQVQSALAEIGGHE